MEWVKVTEKMLARQPDWLYQPLWVCSDGVVRSGEYEWRQGRNPDRFYCEGGWDIHALDNCYVMPLVKPAPPEIEPSNA